MNCGDAPLWLDSGIIIGVNYFVCFLYRGMYINARIPQADRSDIKMNIVVILESLVAGEVLLKSGVVATVEVGNIAVVSVSVLIKGVEMDASLSDTSNGADSLANTAL